MKVCLRLFVGLLLFVPSLLLAQKRTLVDELKKSFSNYGAIESLHIEVDINTSIYGPLPGWPMEKPFSELTDRYSFLEFWANEDLFRIEVRTDPDLRLLQDMEIAYDGHIYQIHFIDSNMLTYTSEGKHNPAMVTAIPQPAFLPFIFVSRNGPSCPGCRLRLVDFHDSYEWFVRMSAAEYITENEVGDGLRIPVQNGPDVEFYSVFVKTMSDGAKMPSLIRSRHGDYSRQILFESYEAHKTKSGVKAWIPQRVVLKNFGVGNSGKEQLLMSTSYSISRTEVDKIQDNSIFTIPTHDISVVYDEDAKEFVKHFDPSALEYRGE